MGHEDRSAARRRPSLLLARMVAGVLFLIGDSKHPMSPADASKGARMEMDPRLTPRGVTS
jgi:2-polyprenyl-6-methoxyphenol hydroxylase-like FAD-dependent oxidoreductase